MIRNLLRWVAPGALTIASGTVAALAMTTPSMVSDLEKIGLSTLSAHQKVWAYLAQNGRNARLSGTTHSSEERDVVLAALGEIPGMRLVEDGVEIAPLDAPYRLVVSADGGQVALSGSVPNAAILDALRGRGGVTAEDLAVRAGHPDVEKWSAAVDFAFEQAAHLNPGTIVLSDLSFAVTGTAKSERDLGALQMAQRQIPAGLRLSAVDVAPVRVEQYMWSAEHDGQRIAVSGYAPDEEAIERIRTADVSGLPIATGLSLASGEPADFSELSKLLLEQLSRLDQGRAEIVDGVGYLEGVPPTYEVAQAVTETLSPSGSVVRLSPPPIADYWVSVTKQTGGVLVFDGYVPDEGTRKSLAKHEGADTSFLKLGSGAPATYLPAVDFALGLLNRLNEGRVGLRGSELSLSGSAVTPSDYTALLAALDQELPQGVTLGDVGIMAPPVANYTLTFERTGAGAVIVSGYLPDPDVEAALLAGIKVPAQSRVAYGSGAPENFVAAAQKAAGFLPWLKEGKISFANGLWTIEGEPNSDLDRASLEAEFAVQQLAQQGWTLSLASPAEPAVASPYVWAAERLEDGSFLLTGFVPSEALRGELTSRVSTRVTDTSQLASGTPAGFEAQARAAIEVLLQLGEGKAAFDGEKWTVSGEAGDIAARDAALDMAIAELGVSADSPIIAPALPLAEPEGDAEAAVAAVVEEQAEVVAEVPQDEVSEVAADEPGLVETPDANEATSEVVEAEDIAVAEAPVEPVQPVASNADIALCSRELAELSSHNAILFQSGAALIADSASAELDAFAATLAKCPQTKVYVEGHTDSDGDDQKNLALSVARAEAVVRALIERGVAASRLYAVGYGESQPIASNDTQDGKRQNRRIVITVEPLR